MHFFFFFTRTINVKAVYIISIPTKLSYRGGCGPFLPINQFPGWRRLYMERGSLWPTKQTSSRKGVGQLKPSINFLSPRLSFTPRGQQVPAAGSQKGKFCTLTTAIKS